MVSPTHRHRPHRKMDRVTNVTCDTNSGWVHRTTLRGFSANADTAAEMPSLPESALLAPKPSAGPLRIALKEAPRAITVHPVEKLIRRVPNFVTACRIECRDVNSKRHVRRHASVKSVNMAVRRASPVACHEKASSRERYKRPFAVQGLNRPFSHQYRILIA